MSASTTYFSFSPSRADTKWELFPTHFHAFIEQTKLHSNNTTDQLGSYLQEIQPPEREELGNIFYELQEEQPSQERLSMLFKKLDLAYGSEWGESVSDHSLEEEWIALLFGDTKFDGTHIRNKEDWIALFTNLSSETLKATVATLIHKELKHGSLTEDEAEDAEQDYMEDLIEYLTCIKPAVQDLKATQDAILVIMSDVSYEAIPPEAETLLNERAAQHAKQFKDINALIS